MALLCQIFDDAVVPLIGAIFPEPDPGTETLAPTHKLGPSPIERHSGSLGSSVCRGNRVPQKQHLALEYAVLRRLPGQRVQLFPDLAERVAQLAGCVGRAGVSGERAPELCEEALQCRRRWSRNRRSRLQAGKNAVAIVGEGDDAEPGRRSLQRVRSGDGNSHRDVALSLAGYQPTREAGTEERPSV
jgi:hypothetical protein